MTLAAWPQSPLHQQQRRVVVGVAGRRSHGSGQVRRLLPRQHGQAGALRSYLNGGSWQLVDEVVEVESGKRNDRPKLAEALRLCRIHKATLIIAKLDRLARNVAFISNLMESGVEFTAADFPQANRLTVHILAAVAEHEAMMISQRTKAALESKRAFYSRLTEEERIEL